MCLYTHYKTFLFFNVDKVCIIGHTMTMKQVNTHTRNDDKVVVTAWIQESTWVEAKIRAAREKRKLSDIYNIAIRQYLGLDREVGHDD